ncbi:hypothetical protein BKA70DRAFT_1232282 [Coprinopsis sp. MPI-PUGE-AT-0042]|nr:hypothetical protein BKA70DRAFT_1232282 [Coprinopsis sp. MPI-PUGE-AT-0042]
MSPEDRVDAYQQKIAAVQATLGLQTDIRTPPPLKEDQTLEEKGRTHKELTLKIERAAWWVRERVPISQSHCSLVGAVRSLLEIRWTEIRRREDTYRERNGSEATLPDFDLILDSEESQGATADSVDRDVSC